MEDVQEARHNQLGIPLAEIAVNITIENLRAVASAPNFRKDVASELN